jgi:hypothetical protein
MAEGRDSVEWPPTALSAAPSNALAAEALECWGNAGFGGGGEVEAPDSAGSLGTGRWMGNRVVSIFPGTSAAVGGGRKARASREQGKILDLGGLNCSLPPPRPAVKSRHGIQSGDLTNSVSPVPPPVRFNLRFSLSSARMPRGMRGSGDAIARRRSGGRFAARRQKKWAPLRRMARILHPNGMRRLRGSAERRRVFVPHSSINQAQWDVG